MRRFKGTWIHDALGVWAVLWSWGPVVLVTAAFARWPSVWTFALAFVLVAFRQNALFVVAHESFHLTLFRNRRMNEVVGALFAAHPIVLPYAQSRRIHLDHHRRVGKDDDPSRFAWKWQKADRAGFFAFFGATLTGVPFVVRALRTVTAGALGKGAASDGADAASRQGLEQGRGALAELAQMALVHLALLGVYAVTVGWVWYFALWLLPAITLHLALDDLRQFLEHREGRLIVYRAGPIERFLFGPFNFHLHAFHHAVASEPWFAVPEIEERARAKLPGIVTLGSYTVELARYVVTGELRASAEPEVTSGAAPAERSTTAPSPR